MSLSNPATTQPARPLWSLALNTEARLPTIAPQDLPLRLLRHHTKNALQRILSEVVMVDDTRLSGEGGRLLRDIGRRIMLSATVSDALFGMTGAPRPMEERMRSLGKATIELLGNPDQIIRLELSIEGDCPEHLRETVLRGASEMIGNAVKHGMTDRMLGRIRVRLDSGSRMTTLHVEDDGWGFVTIQDSGEGLGLTQALAEQHGGRSSVRRTGDWTRAEMMLPHRLPSRQDPASLA